MQVGEIMTRTVVSVHQDAPTRAVAQMLARRRISGLPVVDDAGNMVGLVSEYDLIAKSEARRARDLMTADVISVTASDPIDAVRSLMLDRKIKRVPVLDGQKLVGIVSRGDLVREIALTWICEVCGDHERGVDRPEACPKCGARTSLQPSDIVPVGEGGEAPERICPTCAQPLP